MPEKRIWTPEQDETIRRLRWEGMGYPEIAVALDMPFYATYLRGTRINAVVAPKRPDASPHRDIRGASALPAFHPLFWDADKGRARLDV